ncbi:S41 family peptidase [Lutibacter sp. HS1-25]|uniref:S41 family peptidase n=1 Tax=Lutibacter sp. HS1-25 TaxID=2485000 RepID=UPI0013E91973|nr:S41 family peptidase [Lutibacter sp. HS1-25]
MKKLSYLIAAFLIIGITVVSCNKDDNDDKRGDDVDFSEVEVQNFIWKGLNTYYLWKDNVPNLNNSKDNNDASYLNLLSSKTNPDDFFESLIYDRNNVDKWSWIVDDYVALENSFAGISTSNGVDYRLTYESSNNVDVIGYVRFIENNSDASNKDVKRGYFFDAIDGQQLTVSNYRSLLAQETYTMSFADIVNGDFVSNGKSVELTKSEYHENPVYITKTFDIDSKKIGYLMYNSFTSNYDKELNAAFAQLKSEGVTDLVLDLRYNGGGSVTTATYLAGMITGQFNGELFTKEKWNNELQDWFEKNHPDWLVNNFVNEINNGTTKEPINSLNLTRLYVITTSSSASASELIINGLRPYIDVVTIGTKTAGKYTASITLYDTETFNSPDKPTDAFSLWAMQPIVLQETNKIGENDKDGFDPNYEVIEYIDEMKPLGDQNEPLLAQALALITGVSAKKTISKDGIRPIEVRGFKEESLFQNQMYIDKKLPSGLRN